MPIAARARLANRLIVLAAAGLVVAGLAACDAKSSSSPSGPSILPTADPSTRQVTVVGTGEVQGRPDTLNAQVSIEATAPDVTAAMNQTSDRMQAMINALVGSGIDRNDIATTNVTLQPQYGGGVNNPTIVAYQASNSINVKIRNLNNASQTLGLIGTTGGEATRINSVSFAIDDDSQLVKDARTRAFDDAKDRAEQYAQLAGLTLGDVISISESEGTTPSPPPAPMPRAAMEAVPLEPGQQTVGFSVTVIWELT
ncbi:SIMPL domain-containing protein [Mycolicibacterium sp. 120270]|uniref:SIMPL domain-containing protein n=1 Tax=Mycolicibacterium sp. 120270 TaxID=3090600 RepID=UPI00299DF76E|nr:SIMPL domain-containing protein [Mycolicibacterium sp. 120270]MDX1886761.1 SIMPL domain-containing protein [Mycolicibacterium sp. 120270]